jgi:hypothetical protein
MERGGGAQAEVPRRRAPGKRLPAGSLLHSGVGRFVSPPAFNRAMVNAEVRRLHDAANFDKPNTK